MAELDPKFEPFLRKWRARGGSERAIAESYMRGEAMDAAGYATLPQEPGKTSIHVRVDGRGLDASVDPPALPCMVAEWEAEMEGVPSVERRQLTKNLIVGCIASNRHLEERGALVLSAAIWIAAADEKIMRALQAGDVGLLCNFTFNDEDRTRRLTMEILFP